MNQVAGTQSSNIIYDLIRLDNEYLVRIGPFFWVVRMTVERQEELSQRLVKLSTQLRERYKDEGLDNTTWSVTNLSTVREGKDPLSLEDYLVDAEKEIQ